jgi:hypothetical protein
MKNAISRRSVLRFACGCAGGAVLADDFSISIAAPRLTRACLLTSDGLKVYRVQGQSLTSVGDVVFDQRRALKTTGNLEIDRQLNRAIKVAAGILGVNPAFGFFDPDRFIGDDEMEATTAFAIGLNLVPGTSGTVAFGMTRFRSELYGYDDTGTSVMSIIAHEFGHVVQTDRRYQNSIDYGNPNSVEINADFLAGYYLGVRKLSVPSLQFDKAEQMFARTGNPRPDRRHGNAQERVDAARAGFQIGFIERRSLDDAVRAGLDYIGYRAGR